MVIRSINPVPFTLAPQFIALIPRSEIRSQKPKIIFILFIKFNILLSSLNLGLRFCSLDLLLLMGALRNLSVHVDIKKEIISRNKRAKRAHAGEHTMSRNAHLVAEEHEPSKRVHPRRVHAQEGACTSDKHVPP